MAKTKTFMNEVHEPKGIGDSKVFTTGGNQRPPTNLSTQFLDKKSDMERLVDKGLDNPTWFKGFLNNVGMPKTLDYAEASIKSTGKLNEKEKNELLDTIASHPLRQQKKTN
jgi:hypothetical protein